MPGFFITNTEKVPTLTNYVQSRCVQGELQYGQWHVHRNVLDKYMDDKLFFQNDAYIVVLDGVILNKRALIAHCGDENWEETFLHMVREKEDFFEAFRGVFAGAVYFKQRQKWIVFTDQTNSHLLLTYVQEGRVAFGTQMNYFSEWMKLSGIKREVDPVWEEDFFTFGTMIDSHTILKDVNRIHPGCYGYYDETRCELYERIYCQMTKREVDHNITIQQAIDQLDELFRQAIRRILDKDAEYGYTTLVDISGGLDSRMIARIAVELGKDNVMLNTYGQPGCDEYKSAQKVRRVLDTGGFDFQLKTRYLMDIDDLVWMNNGMNYYTGAMGVWRCLELLDRKMFGAQCWGLLGDIWEGAMIHHQMSAPPNWQMPRYRMGRTIPFTPEFHTERWSYEDNELLWFYARGMFAGLNTAQVRQNFLEPITPFGDVEFMRFCFSLPEDMRVKDHVYRRWMKYKYPEIARVPYASTGIPVMVHSRVEWLCALPRRIWRKFQTTLLGSERTWLGMDLDLWYEKDCGVHQAIDKYYRDNLHILNEWPQIKQKVECLFAGNQYADKTMALTALSAVKQYLL